MRRCMLFLVILGALAIPVGGQVRPDAAAVRKAIRDFREKFAMEDMAVRMEALRILAETRHALAIEEIGKRVLTDDDPEVRMAGAMLLGKVDAAAEVAGPHLRDLLCRNDDHPEVQVEFIRTIRKLDYRGAHDQLVTAAMRFLERDYRFVVMEVMKTFGAQKDASALPFMLKLAEYNTETLRGRRGPQIRTSSSASQADRRAMWMKLYGKFMMPKDEPGVTTKWWLWDLVQAVKEITGKDFADPHAFRIWLLEHRRELKIRKSDLDRRRKLKPPKPRNPPEDESDD